MKTRRCASASFPRASHPRWSSKAAASCSTRRNPAIEDFKPQVMIFANGDLSSFEIRLQREGGGERARIYTDEQTNIQMLLPGETEPKTPAARTAQRQ